MSEWVTGGLVCSREIFVCVIFAVCSSRVFFEYLYVCIELKEGGGNARLSLLILFAAGRSVPVVNMCLPLGMKEQER